MYKITFRLITHCVFTHRPTFDSMLAFCYLADKGDVDAPLIIDSLEDFSGLPLKRHHDGFFLASSMFFTDDQQQTAAKKKKWEDAFDHIVRFSGKKRGVEINRGLFKSYDMPRVEHTFASTDRLAFSRIGHVWFYFESDDVDEVRRLIDSHLVGIGKDVNTGKGWFDEYVIEQTDERDFEIEVLRPIPMRLAGKRYGKIANVAWQPPGWLPSNFDKCVVPG